MLVQKFARHPAVIASRERHREDRLVLGIGFFGDECARHVEIAVRPATLGAESADVGDDFADFVVCELVAERRHHAIERARGTALMDHRLPIEIGFRRREAAVGEIGRFGLEAADGAGLPASIGTVTGRAGGVIQLLGRSGRRRSACARVEAHVENQERD